MAILVYKLQQFDYEYANFDPYDILGVSMVSQSGDFLHASLLALLVIALFVDCYENLMW